MSNGPTQSVRLVSLWPLLLILLFVIPGISGFPYPSAEAQYTDIAISHYPNAIYLKETLRSGNLPWWSPAILSGYPFAANPLAGLWYPLGWLALLFPLPLGFNVLIILHLLWGGLGMYLLLRAENLSHRASLLGALAFEWMPKIWAHWGAGHLTLVYAIPWTPWLLLSIYTSRRSVLRHSARPQGVFSGLIMALIFLADPRWAAMAGLLWLAYWFVRSRSFRKSALISQPIQSDSVQIELQLPPVYGWPPLLVQLVIAALLAAPLLLPLLEYTALSTRANLSSSEMLVFSLPQAQLFGLIFPDWHGSQERILYVGAVILILSWVALLAWRSQPQKRFWLWAALAALVFSLGSNIPLLSKIVQLPGFSLLRVPTRALFVTGMAWAALAAYGVDLLLSSSGLRNQRWISLGLTALTAFVAILAVGIVFLAPEFPANFVWGALAIGLASLGVLVVRKGWASSGVWFAGILGVALIDWTLMNTSVLNFHPSSQVLGEQNALAAYLADQPGDFRVYSPSYSLPQQTAAHYGFELADGVDPLQLAAYAAFMEPATGVPRSGYSVTMPPFATGDPQNDNAAYRPDPALLGLLNVRFVAAQFDLAVENLELRQQFGETRLYENLLARPRAWVQPEEAAAENVFEPATILERRPNQIRVVAEGPGLLVLSEIAYPGWQVSVDGIPSQLQTPFDLLRGVQLSPGQHEIRFSFHPSKVYQGLWGFAAGCLLLAVSIWLRKRRAT